MRSSPARRWRRRRRTRPGNGRFEQAASSAPLYRAYALLAGESGWTRLRQALAEHDAGRRPAGVPAYQSPAAVDLAACEAVFLLCALMLLRPAAAELRQRLGEAWDALLAQPAFGGEEVAQLAALVRALRCLGETAGLDERLARTAALAPGVAGLPAAVPELAAQTLAEPVRWRGQVG